MRGRTSRSEGLPATDLIKAVRAQIREGLERVEGQPIREYGSA